MTLWRHRVSADVTLCMVWRTDYVFSLAARGGADVAASAETATATQTSAIAAPSATSNDSVATLGVGGRNALHVVADRLRFYLLYFITII
jgi:hypothetical protein